MSANRRSYAFALGSRFGRTGTNNAALRAALESDDPEKAVAELVDSMKAAELEHSNDDYHRAESED